MSSKNKPFKWTPEKVQAETNLVKTNKSVSEVMTEIGCKKSCAYDFVKKIAPENIGDDYEPFVVK